MLPASVVHFVLPPCSSHEEEQRFQDPEKLQRPLNCEDSRVAHACF